MNRNIIGLSIVIIGMLLLAGIVYFIFIYRFDNPAADQGSGQAQGQLPALDPSQQQASSQNKPAVTLSDAKTARIKLNSAKTKENISEDEIRRLALSFTERFGSYSNQSGYNNIEDLKVFMTSKMRDWSDDFIRQANASQSDAASYYGINTKAITASVNSFNKSAGEAEVMVKAQRWETSGTAKNKAYYQNILVSFRVEDNTWKVNGVYWKERID